MYSTSIKRQSQRFTARYSRRLRHTKLQRIKIGTALDAKLYNELKAHAAQEGRAVNDVIEDALERYFHTGSALRDMRVAAIERMCSHPYTLSRKEIDELLQEDYYDQ
jgi:hypothetical protein